MGLDPFFSSFFELYKSDLIFLSCPKHMQLYDILQEMELNIVCLTAKSGRAENLFEVLTEKNQND
jgi:hypothetical protein